LAVYAAPAVPLGREVVVSVRAGGAFTTKARDAVAVIAGLELSVTVRVTFDVPTAVGVPLMDWPFTLNPAGNPLAFHVYGCVPPLAESATL
jgi:hypothetical protein